MRLLIFVTILVLLGCADKGIDRVIKESQMKTKTPAPRTITTEANLLHYKGLRKLGHNPIVAAKQVLGYSGNCIPRDIIILAQRGEFCK